MITISWLKLLLFHFYLSSVMSYALQVEYFLFSDYHFLLPQLEIVHSANFFLPILYKDIDQSF